MKRQKIKTFRNIPNTRAANSTYVMTSAEMKKYAMCHGDVIYFLESVLGLKLYAFQVEMVKNYLKNRYNVHLCSRDVYQSTIMSGVFLWEMTFWSDYSIMVMSKHSLWFDKLFDHYKKVPYFMQLGISNMKFRRYLTFDNGSRVRTTPYPKDNNFALGSNYSSLFYGDFAYLKDEHQKKCLQAVVPVVGALKTCKLTLASQPNGMNTFYDIVVDAERFDGDPSKNAYTVFRAYWWQILDRDRAWKERRIYEIGENAFNAEYDLSFKTF